jgi:hypothetical protein
MFLSYILTIIRYNIAICCYWSTERDEAAKILFREHRDLNVKKLLQDRHSRYNVTMRRVRATIVAVEKQ